MGALNLFTFACFYLALSLLHLFFFHYYYYCFCFWDRNQSCVPPPTHKTKPCSYNCVICFPSVIESSFSAGWQINRFWGEKKEEEKYLFHIAILNYSYFLASCLILLFNFPYFLSLFTPTLHNLDNRHDTFNDGGFASSLGQVQTLFFWTVMMMILVCEWQRQKQL